MIRLHHVSFLTKNIFAMKNFYSNIFNAKIAHKFINKSNKQVYGYFLYLSKGTFIEIIKSEKKITNKKLISLNHFCVLASKYQFNNIYKKIKKTKNLKSKKKRGKTDGSMNFSFYDPDENLCEVHLDDDFTILKKYNKYI